ncbi:MAG: VOC family protein [Ktedonobacteraceae bacterium]
MLTGIDHIIIGVHDLEEAARHWGTQLGLPVSGGGRHPTGGTANRIIVIGDTYLELITVHVPGEAQQSMLDRLALGEGYLNFALASDAIEADSAAMRTRGVSIMGPAAGQLRSAGGRERGWSRTNVERPDLTQRYPFLIQHDSAGEERRSRLAGWRTPPELPLGATAVLSLTLAVNDLHEATRRLHHIYGLEPSPSFTSEPDGWEAVLVAFPLGNGGQSIELAAPLPIPSDLTATNNALLPEPGALTWYLERFGEGLCRMTLGVRDLTLARSYLDEHKVSYIYRDEPQASLWIHPQDSNGAAIVLHEHQDG